MAAYNFPNSPSDGDTVTSNGITYTYSSSKTRWDGAAPSGSSTTVYATIDDLPLSGASTGDQAYVSGNNRLYIWNGTGWYNIALINTTPSISGASASYNLASDGTATTVTITATDPEGIPITYSIASDTSGNIATVSQGTGANTNVFTITPSTNTANGGTFSLTFRASDGVNIATAVSSFTLQFAVENSNYTTALITSVGANNAVNNSFDDASTNNHTITANGNVTQNSFSPYRHAGYSTYLDGNGDTLVLPNDSSFNLNGEFCIEFWVYLEGSSYAQTVQRVIAPNSTTYGVTPYISIGNDTGITGGGAVAGVLCATRAVTAGNPQMHANTTGTTATGTYKQIPLNKWVHCALTRDSSNVVRMWQDGVLVATNTETSAFDFTYSSTVGPRIGQSGWASQSSTTGEALTGFISDFRIVKGSAVYTSAFTPPEERLTAITNTSLLTCHLPYIKDGSTNSHSITVNGNTKTEPFSPFDHTGYTASDNGGSMYFDGNDSLSLPQTSLDLGSDDFCVEAWVYTTSTSNQCIVGSYRYADGVGAWNLNINYNSKKIRFFIRHSSGSVIDGQFESGTFPTNQWVHVAVTRDGSNLRAFINGTQAGSTNTSIGSNTIDNAQTNYYVGVATDSQIYWQGYISDVRVVKGSSVYTAAFTPPTAPLTAVTNTSLLINGTDAGIIDKSQSVKTITLNGNAKSSTAKSKYLTSSMYFDGTGDYVQTNTSDLYKIGTGQFTAECWMNVSDDTQHALFYFMNGGNDVLGVFYYHTNNSLGVVTSSAWITGNAGSGSNHNVLNPNQWHHVAISRDATTFRAFVDGTQVYSGSNSDNFGSNLIRIASHQYSTDLYGHISDFRFTKGLARYTSNFTVPSAALQG